MPHEPKKRHSRERQGKRRAHIKLAVKKSVICPNCGKSTPSHTVCKNCGYYKGKQMVQLKVKSAKKAQETT